MAKDLGLGIGSNTGSERMVWAINSDLRLDAALWNRVSWGYITRPHRLSPSTLCHIATGLEVLRDLAVPSELSFSASWSLSPPVCSQLLFQLSVYLPAAMLLTMTAVDLTALWNRELQSMLCCCCCCRCLGDSIFSQQLKSRMAILK